MCGRYTLRDSSRAVREVLGLVMRTPTAPSYNVAPSQVMPVAVRSSQRVVLDQIAWGFVPWYARGPQKTPMVIKNTRIETGMTKLAFRKSFEQRRCVIPADGFYEWKREGDKKQPFFIRLKGDRPFGFAGIWEPAEWKFPAGFSIVTTTPNKVLAKIHDRMPVMLTAEQAAAWLEPRPLEASALAEFTRPFPTEEMEAYQVSTYVNNWRNAGPPCIAPIASTEASFKLDGEPTM
jgi:putative SOS response-associated peptidase YedK